jgi:hypothetical protein
MALTRATLLRTVQGPVDVQRGMYNCNWHCCADPMSMMMNRVSRRSFKEQSESEEGEDHSNDDASDDSGVSEDGSSEDVSEDDVPVSAGKTKRAKVDDWSEDDE